MNVDIIIVCIVLVFILISLYKELIGVGFTFLIGVATLGFFQVITPSEILIGFANEQVAIIIMLLLLGDIFKKTPLLDLAFDKVFKTAVTPSIFRARMMALVAFFSAFLNNTPIVALMMPYVYNWSKRHKTPISQLLIPLSFSAILGGCATLIGTSTNMIVNGLLMEQTLIPELKTIPIFDFIYVGFPMIIIGILYLLFIAPKILPSNKNKLEEYKQNLRKYIVEVEVKKNSQLIGENIKESNLKNIEDLYLIEIFRYGQAISKKINEVKIKENDILLFSGKTETIANLINSDSSLVIPSVGMFSKKKKTEIIEIVISHNSFLIGKTLESENFRGKYDATVIAIHRNGDKQSHKIGSIKMRAGDVLLLLAEDNFVDRVKDINNFHVISKIKDIRKFEWYKSLVLVGGSFLIIILSAFHLIKLFMGLLILLSILVAMDITKPKDIVKSIDFNLVFVIALSLSIGLAMTKTGFANMIATFMIYILFPLGKIGVLAGIFIITSILGAYITSKAAAAIIFPISLTMSLQLETNPMPFVLIVAFAAAANFMTPIGYQTNLMVFGPGGYSFKDFLKVGLPLTLIYMIVTLLIFNYMYF